MLASRFSIISPRELYERHAKEDLAARYGFENKLISVRLIPFQQPLGEVGQLSRQRPIPENLVQLTMDTCIKAIEEDGAPAITFGCAYLARIIDEVDVRLKAEGFNVTVIRPFPLTVEVARLLIKLKLSHSATAFQLANPLLE
jgi:allantoin racemase